LKLLDWFAGCALSGMLSNPEASFGDIAQQSFRIAREMLKARERHVPREEAPTPPGWVP